MTNTVTDQSDGIVSRQEIEEAFVLLRATLNDPHKDWSEEGKEGAEWVMLVLLTIIDRIRRQKASVVKEVPHD